MNILEMFEVCSWNYDDMEEYSDMFNTLEEALTFACSFPVDYNGQVHIHICKPELKDWRIR